jgi:hypothetical protein
MPGGTLRPSALRAHRLIGRNRASVRPQSRCGRLPLHEFQRRAHTAVRQAALADPGRARPARRVRDCQRDRRPRLSRLPLSSDHVHIPGGRRGAELLLFHPIRRDQSPAERRDRTRDRDGSRMSARRHLVFERRSEGRRTLNLVPQQLRWWLTWTPTGGRSQTTRPAALLVSGSVHPARLHPAIRRAGRRRLQRPRPLREQCVEEPSSL